MRTDNPFDLALEGDGFFKVRDNKSGEISYTRNGSFTLDRSKFIMTKEGEYLLDQNNRPIRIDISELDMNNNNQFTVNEKGQIEINGRYGKTPIDQRVAIYDFEDKEKLFNVGGSKFVSKDMENNPPIPAEKFTIARDNDFTPFVSIFSLGLSSINIFFIFRPLFKVSCR